MRIREASRVFGLHRDTVGKMLAHSVPPGYRRQGPLRRPRVEPYTGVIDRILEFALAWLSVSGWNSVILSWVRHQFPNTVG